MRRSSYLLAALLTAPFFASVAAADQGYLPAVGPAPIRFVRPRPASAEPPLTIVLPPARSTNAPEVPLKPATNSTTASVTHPASTPTASSTNETTATALPHAVPAPPPAPEVAMPAGIQAVMPQPQLFLQYFTPDYMPATNGYGVVLPVGFIPPQPRTSGSSASYQVIGPEKP